MENKYYTPEIGEFCVGFEFQKKEIVSKGSFLEEDWVDIKFDFDDFTQTLRDFTEDSIFDKNDYRVKHLDQEDIIECGWYKHHDTYFSFKNKDIKSHSNEYFLNDVLVLSDSYFLEITDSIITIQDFDYEVIFKGTIKNKSELKKLMQMLNIQTDAK
jgi:hypothetical protein